MAVTSFWEDPFGPIQNERIFLQKLKPETFSVTWSRSWHTSLDTILACLTTSLILSQTRKTFEEILPETLALTSTAWWTITWQFRSGPLAAFSHCPVITTFFSRGVDIVWPQIPKLVCPHIIAHNNPHYLTSMWILINMACHYFITLCSIFILFVYPAAFITDFGIRL